MRILIVEDNSEWQAELGRMARAATQSNTDCDYAASLETARCQVGQRAYALVLVDLGLPVCDGESGESNENGMRLLREIRREGPNTDTPCIVLTALGTTEAMHEAFKKLNVSDFLAKDCFSPQVVQGAMREALFKAAAARADQRDARKFELTFTLTGRHLVSAQLAGPDCYHDYFLDDPLPFAADRLSQRADRINLLVSSALRRQTLNEWRESARDIGQALYDSVFHHTRVSRLLDEAHALAPAGDVRLCFRGPRTSPSVPFELLHDGDEYLALRDPISRQVTSGPAAARKAGPFHSLLTELHRQSLPLRVLLLASSAGPDIGAVDQEVAGLKTTLEQRLAQIGLRGEVQTVFANEADYATVEQLLRERTWHVVHYAGHGRWDDHLPEHSALLFRNGAQPRAMPASVLQGFLQNSATRLCYLSCCLGARQEDRVGQGDFHGLVDGLVQADVPMVVAHRWSVSDAAARDLALAFYDELSAHWSIEDALFEARQAVIRQSPSQRDDPAWASPVLVAQTAYYRGGPRS